MMPPFEEIVQKLTLTRYPQIDNSLQAWSAADSYLYNRVTPLLSDKKERILILNDDYGVLALALSQHSVVSVHDSITARIALNNNAEANKISLDSIRFVPSTEIATLESEEPFTYILCRIPKAVTYFKDQLRSLRHLFKKDTVLLTAGMVKHISKSTAKLLEGYVGPTLTDRVYKKSILFSSTVRQTKSEAPQIKEFNTPLGSFKSYANTFSNGKIDAGTEELLQALPPKMSGLIVDLGCGYGPVSKAAASLAIAPFTLYAVDISHMAVASTALNVPEVNASVGDGLQQFDDASLDWVLSNPPFHQNTTFSVNEGLRLFKQVAQKLKPGGTFLMVANSGLNYSPYLNRLFSTLSIVRSSKKYTVFSCTV